MSDLPIRPHLKSYRGANPEKARKTAQFNRDAQRVADYLNKQIADDPAENQQHFFAEIGLKLHVSDELVRSAIPFGGYNGITIRVTPVDRERLEAYRIQAR